MASIRVKDDTKKEFDDLYITMWWINISSADDKLKHLIWFYNNFEKYSKVEHKNILDKVENFVDKK